jgi:hypothetical protein
MTIEKIKDIELYQSFLNSKKPSIKWKSYFEVYNNIFQEYKDKKVTFVEVGIDRGGSLFIWKDFFSNDSRIIGIDTNPEAKKLEEHGFEIFIGDQSNESFWSDFYKKVGNIDILLDDGGHKNIEQIITTTSSLPYINNGGKIVIEDTHASYIKKHYRNPSIFSSMNFFNLIVDSINRRCPEVNNTKANIYTNKVHSVNFYESIVVLDIDEKKCSTNELLFNNEHNKSLSSKVDVIIDNKDFFIIKHIKKIFNKRFLLSIIEKIKILRIFRNIKYK